MAGEKPITKAAAYAWLFPQIAEVARELGYALGLHGSLQRDLDVIAVPWIDAAAPAEVLVAAIRGRVDGLILETGTKGGRWDAAKGEFVEAIIENPSVKPHGRLAWNIHLHCGLFIDLSVMPRKNGDDA